MYWYSWPATLSLSVGVNSLLNPVVLCSNNQALGLLNKGRSIMRRQFERLVEGPVITPK